MEGLSKREIKVVSGLEFDNKYFFKREDIKKYFDTNIQMKDSLHRLQKKKRIIKLNKNKYYLVPIKARSGKWSEDPYITIDEIMNGEGYFIGGWTAANYWRITDQIPFKHDVWTTKRYGKIDILNTQIIFHRTTPKKIKDSAIIQKEGEHEFKIIKKEMSMEWLKQRR